jgi:DNA-binding IscR family transcriptional regulator
MRRWVEFQREHSALLQPALEVFEDLRKSGRSVRTRISQQLTGTGVAVDDLLEALANEGLVEIRRGRRGGIFYPKK